MKRLLLRLACFLPLVYFLSCPAHPLSAEDNAIVRVRKGDTVSYLSFKIYGKYNAQIAEILRRENPKVKDLNLIYAGQQLNFPSPKSLGDKLGREAAPEPRGEKSSKTTPAVQEAPPKPSPLSETAVRAGKAVITYVDGQAQVKRAEEARWEPAKPNQILSVNDQVKVLSQSRVEVILDNQSVLRLSENSLLTLLKMEEDRSARKESTRTELSLGRLWVRAAKLITPGSRNDVKTPTVIAGVQGTTYQVQILGNRSTKIQVFDGAVNVYNPFPTVASGGEKPAQVAKPREVAGPQEIQGPTTVSREQWTEIVLHQYQQITVTGQEVPRPTSFDPQKERQDEWVKWNQERDADFKPPARSE